MATAESLKEVQSRENDAPTNIDALTHLEERVQKTVALVNRLRQDKDATSRELSSVQAALAAALSSLEETKLANAQLTEDLNALRAEKLQVRNRLEKLLGHIDQLGA